MGLDGNKLTTVIPAKTLSTIFLVLLCFSDVVGLETAWLFSSLRSRCLDIAKVTVRSSFPIISF